MKDKIGLALEIAYNFGGIDGDHHKEWVIDQMVRALTGDRYDKWVKRYCSEFGDLDDPGEENFFEWKTGIDP